MAGPAFNPTGAVKFDLKNGAAHDAGGARLLLVPSAAFEGIDDAVLARLGEAVGKACGARVSARLGGDVGVRAAPLESVVSHLAGELAIAGIGAIHVERWGRAMVCVVTNPGVANDAFLAGVVGSALSAASGSIASAASLGREGGTVRFFVGTRATADRVDAMVREGRGYADIVSSLQGARA